MDMNDAYKQVLISVYTYVTGTYNNYDTTGYIYADTEDERAYLEGIQTGYLEALEDIMDYLEARINSCKD